MKKWLFAVLFGSALVLGACGGGDDDANNSGNNDGGGETASAGEEIYEDNCAACHGADLAGGGGPALDAIGSKYSADEIVDIIHNGIGGMPAQKQVSDDDAQTLADWLAEKQ
ncbi:cytochrome c551 [Ornithinibacillus halophilus]|uniref:Cytochrome c551 n=1 Tax=Ornithinibacillus halophilus TaxID=930117 RepID=A0A1M5FBS9_9BACI|nr:cytochrome c [Ornithinibacillus halophilus]SHF89004.1 cytochrome c551 [Ornithinibacillus halophilus]